MNGSINGWPKEALTEIETLTTKVGELEQQVTKLVVQKPDDTAEDIWKGVHPEVKRQFEENQRRAEAAEAIAKRERDERLTREYITKAKSYEEKPYQFKPQRSAAVVARIATRSQGVKA